jgi:Flp pilus assembly protein TadD
VLAVSILSPLAVTQSRPGTQQSIATLEQQAQEYLHEQKPQLAIPVYREIIALDPKNLNANGNLGVLLFFQSDYRDAIPRMRTALELNPELWRIRALLGIAEKRTGDATAAPADLSAAFPQLHDLSIKKQTGLELVELDSSSARFAGALSVVQELERLLPTDPQVIFVAYEISSQMMDRNRLRHHYRGQYNGYYTPK